MLFLPNEKNKSLTLILMLRGGGLYIQYIQSTYIQFYTMVALQKVNVGGDISKYNS